MAISATRLRLPCAPFMRVLYVGPTLAGSTSLQRLEALRELGHDVVELRSTDLTRMRRLWHRVGLKLGLAADCDGANATLLERVDGGALDLVWLDKPITIRPATLARVRDRAPMMCLAGYSPDDMLIRPNRTRRFLGCLPYLDVFFTTKPHTVEPLRALGARQVEVVGNAYAEAVHRPLPRCAADRAALGGGIGFIGDYEEDRRQMIAALAGEGLKVRIWGPNWRRYWRHPPPGVRIEGRSLSDDEYARAICNFDINLAFLRKAARDEITTRSMEIPACGGFMLAERTAAHRAAFLEGVEAEFFGSTAELVEKCRAYLAQPEQARVVGAAGRVRCLRDGYGNRARLGQMLQCLDGLGADPGRC